MTSSVTFPLADKYLPKVSLTQQEITEYRVAVNEIVAKTLEQEIEFRYRRDAQLDSNKWKFVKAKDRLKVYKRLPPNTGKQRPSSSSNAAHQVGPLAGHRRTAAMTSPPQQQQPSPQQVVPMVVAIGKVDGLMEDALYGVHHKTTEEMRITTSFLNKHHLDSAVLHTIDSGTDADPFRYLGIKWRVAGTPGGNLISNRDVCVLEYVGTSVDALGHKYGFHVIKSIEAKWFPELPDPHIVRARMMLCCIYRQIEPNVVDCYMKGVFNLGGELIDLIAYNTAADTLLGISRTVDCAEAKKLTLRMILEQKKRMKNFYKPSSSSSQGSMSRSSGGGSRGGSGGGSRSRGSTGATYTEGSFTVDRCALEEDDLDSFVGAADFDQGDDLDHVCSVCDKERSVLSKLGGSHWDRCRICHKAVCSKCHVRKTVFARPKHIKVACCKLCVLAARELPVDPRDPYPVIGNMIG